MKILIEVEINSSGKAESVRLVAGKQRAKQRRRRELTEADPDDCLEIEFLREFIGKHGASDAARRLGVSRAALYQWTYRNHLPEKYLGIINRINQEKWLNEVD